MQWTTTNTLWNESVGCIRHGLDGTCIRHSHVSIKSQQFRFNLHEPALLLFLDVKRTVEEIFSDVFVPMNCEVLVAQGHAEVTLTKVHHIHPSRRPLQKIPLGRWNALDGIKWANQVGQRQNDLKGAVIRGAFILEAPYVIRKVQTGTPQDISGYAMEFWQILQSRLNFRPPTFMEGLNRVCTQSKYGFVLAEVTFWGLQRDVPCKIVTVPKAYYAATSSFVFSKGSPYAAALGRE
ncbi:hypothetical protein C0J52_11677 [Blattella germanica]|nr:hypothetical protein C0J52_11677 [Blattella germanica]